ncbi:MAG: Gfo/Idh/MocA family oxidoreductase [Mariniblastus sp.]|nr:Gfo/Idh/MocA family oxidoreductase [Mariniblastus sp.]
MSTATIGRKNWQAIKLSGNGAVVAVASRSAQSSQKYIDECQAAAPFDNVPRAIEGYDHLLAADDIDAVYIPLPTGMRKEWVIRAANAGKHVMCEKPCACNAVDLAEMIEACQANNVQFMDGVMYMHGLRLEKVREALRDIGKLKRITTQFSFCGDQEFEEGNIRTNSDLEPLGALGDLGWYTIRFALWVMDYEMPKRVIGRMLTEYKREDSPHAVPMEIEAELQFENGITSTFYNSFVTGHQQWAHVSGTEGHVYIPDFVLPYAGGEAKFEKSKPEFSVNACDFEMTQNQEQFVIHEPGNSAVNSQETNLFRNFASIILSGRTDDHWPSIALKTQQLMDACYQSATNESQVIEIS